MPTDPAPSDTLSDDATLAEAEASLADAFTNRPVPMPRKLWCAKCKTFYERPRCD